MSSRPRALQTAHLRSKFQRGIRRCPPPPVRNPSSLPNDTFSHLQPCIRLPEDITDLPLKSPQLSQPPPNPTQSPEQHQLCLLLSNLSRDFQRQKRPYVAMAASMAISLIQDGRQDDINPGLWAHIKRLEDEGILPAVQLGKRKR